MSQQQMTAKESQAIWGIHSLSCAQCQDHHRTACSEGQLLIDAVIDHIRQLTVLEVNDFGLATLDCPFGEDVNARLIVERPTGKEAHPHERFLLPEVGKWDTEGGFQFPPLEDPPSGALLWGVEITLVDGSKREFDVAFSSRRLVPMSNVWIGWSIPMMVQGA